MERHSGKRGFLEQKNRHGVTFKDASSEREQKARSCNRIGCRGMIKYNQTTKNGSFSNAECSKSSSHSSNGKEIIGTSSRSTSVVTRAKTSFLDSKRKVPSQMGFDPLSNSHSGVSQTPKLASPSRSRNVTEIGSSSVSSSKIRPREILHHKFGPNQSTPPTSSVPSVSQVNNRSRYGLRNMKCNSISDVVPSRSSSESKSTGKNVVKRRSQEGESSGGRKTTSTSSVDRSRYSSTRGITISGDDRTRATSVRTRRSTNVNNSRIRNSSSLQEPKPEITTNVDGPGPSNWFSANGSSSGSSSYRSLSSSNNDDQLAMMPFTYDELGFDRYMNRDAFGRYNIDEIAEVLLALERIEQFEELTHEQVVALENGLFPSGLNLYDQHRDMRLDIDNMSYEELLALEERIGTVSTALSEESLLKCLRRSIHQGAPSEERVPGSGEDRDDVKCSICQEEYIIGDEIGELVECRHSYHATCINQWLQIKNWCPICKAAAAPPQSSSS